MYNQDTESEREDFSVCPRNITQRQFIVAREIHPRFSNYAPRACVRVLLKQYYRSLTH